MPSFCPKTERHHRTLTGCVLGSHGYDFLACDNLAVVSVGQVCSRMLLNGDLSGVMALKKNAHRSSIFTISYQGYAYHQHNLHGWCLLGPPGWHSERPFFLEHFTTGVPARKKLGKKCTNNRLPPNKKAKTKHGKTLTCDSQNLLSKNTSLFTWAPCSPHIPPAPALPALTPISVFICRLVRCLYLCHFRD